MLNLLKNLVLSVAVVALAGCAAAVKETPAPSSTPTAAARQQAPAGALVAVVTGSPALQGNEDWPAFLNEWQAALTAAASTAKLPLVFAKDEAALPADASVLIRLNVNSFRYVSTGKRFMLGIMAGNAYMDVDAQYVELPASKPFGAKKFNTSSSAWEGIFSAVTPKQVQAVSDVIVKDVASTAPAK